MNQFVLIEQIERTWDKLWIFASNQSQSEHYNDENADVNE